MYLAVLWEYFLIAKVNLQRNYLPHTALSALFLFMTPVIFGTANLDPKAAAIPLEMFISLIGIVLVTPVFLPEQQKEIRDVVESKYTGQNGIYIVRIVTAMIIMLLFISCFVLFMKQSGCEFDVIRYVLGTFASGLFLGSLGLFSYGVSDNAALGYMVPLIYYMLNMFGGSKYLGVLNMFSMSKGSFNEKYWLLGAGLFLFSLALCWKGFVRKIR